MRLHPLPSEGRFYCGPAAIAAFTGKHPKEEVREAINKVRNRAPNQGVVLMYCGEIVKTLERFGVKCSNGMKHADKLTLKDFVARHPHGSFVVNVTNHFVAVSNGMCLDNKSRIARPAAVFPGNRKRVVRVIQIFEA